MLVPEKQSAVRSLLRKTKRHLRPESRFLDMIADFRRISRHFASAANFKKIS